MASGPPRRHAGGVEFDAPPHPHKRLYIALAVIAVVLLALAGLVARPVYHWVNRWRALQSVEASAQAQRAGDSKTAYEKAQTALNLWPYDARVFRQMATVVSAMDPAAALPYWQKTWSMSYDPVDLRAFVDTAVNAANFPLAVDLLTQLQKLDPNSVETWKLVARIRLSQNNVPEALAALKNVLANSAAPEDTHLLYAQTSLFSTDQDEYTAGLNYLLTLSERTDDFGLRALRSLANDPRLPPTDYADVTRKLLAHPQANLDDKLAALRLEGEEPGIDEDTLVKAARDLFPPNNPDALVNVARWLRATGRPAAALKILDSATAMTRQDMFLVRIDAMADLGQWAAVEELLNQPDLPLPKENQLLLQALTMTKLNRGDRADLAWERLHNEIADQPKKQLDVALRAIHFGLDDIARPMLQAIISDPDTRRAACEQLVMLERRAKNTEALHSVLGQMASFYPQDVVVHNDYLYTGFLLGQTGPEQVAAAQSLVTDNPHILSFRFTLAEGLLTANRPVDALQVFSDLAESTWPTAYNHWNAVYIAVLRANGQLKKADWLENYVKQDDLLLEEEKLLLTAVPVGSNSITN